MQRIHAPFDEPTLEQIDKEVERSGSSRAQWLSSAIGSYLRLLELTKGADPVELVTELRQTRLNNESLWKENQQLKRAEEKAREDVAQTGRKLSALEDHNATTIKELETTRSDMILLERDKTHFQDTIKLKDQEIAFLQAHISQLTQTVQLALPPAKEETKKKGKGWWQFWK
jgi:chromosome segregation ATPase